MDATPRYQLTRGASCCSIPGVLLPRQGARGAGHAPGDMVHAAGTIVRWARLTRVSGHGFCPGGVSYAFRAGMPDALIQQQGDSLGMAFMEYLTLAPAKVLEATRAIVASCSSQRLKGGSMQASTLPVLCPRTTQWEATAPWGRMGLQRCRWSMARTARRSACNKEGSAGGS